jgi:hypothetical protein
MEDRYVFSENIFDKNKIQKLIHKKKLNKVEGDTITLLISGHGRERYKEKFDKVILQNPNFYSEPFIYKVTEQKQDNTVRILSKAGKPKICAWDYGLCTESMSSQEVLLKLSHLFFSDENKNIDTFNIMNSMSLYFKNLYPKIIEKISKYYRDLPEDKDPYSPGAVGYEKRYDDFSKVLESLDENKFSVLKALNHEKVFTIRPDNEEEYKQSCQKYMFEIVDLRVSKTRETTDFIVHHLNIRENLVKNIYEMNKSEIAAHIHKYKNSVYSVYLLNISDYEKYYLAKFLFTIYFANEILLSEIIEFFVILGIETINIIDNTCRVQEKSRAESSSVKTSQIEDEEQIKYPKIISKTSSSRRRRTTSSSKSRKKM